MLNNLLYSPSLPQSQIASYSLNHGKGAGSQVIYCDWSSLNSNVLNIFLINAFNWFTFVLNKKIQAMNVSKTPYFKEDVSKLDG